ncbi:MAG: citramalate synthase, partial [Planctomycetota bacterium]
VCAFGMTRRRSVAASQDPGMLALVNAQTPICTVVGKTWDYHATEVLRATLDENLEMIADSVQFLASHCDVMYDAEHFFDGWKANPNYAADTIRAAVAAGAKWVILCDTNGGSLPEDVARLTRDAVTAIDNADVKVGIHCHNDSELAVANSLASIDAGAVQVQGTINGIGERCGNVDLIAMIANLGLKKSGYQVLGGRPLTSLTQLSRFVYETANMQHRNNQPFVGASAFAHKGGMHVHAINKAAKTYEHLDPTLVGNERRVLVSELSGRSNIAALTAKSGLDDDRELMDRILKEVVRLENDGYQFESAGASFDLLVRRLSGTFTEHFETIKYRVVAGNRNASADTEPDSLLAPGNVFAEAIIKLKVGQDLFFDAAEGHGPVNALDAALRKTLESAYGEILREMRLLDYKVRVVDSGLGTAA